MLYWFFYVLFFLPIRILYPTKIYGKRNLIKHKSIWACNHQTLLDPVLVCFYSNSRAYALAKKEIFSNKFKNWFYTKIGGIKVDRGTADITAVKNVLNVLKKKDKPVLVFPTGTRMKDVNEVTELKNGVAMFGLKAQAKIVPIMFLNRPKMFHLTKIVVGKPIDLSNYYDQKPSKELLSKISEDLSVKMEELLNFNSKTKDKKRGK